jgi:hypothetical protein
MNLRNARCNNKNMLQTVYIQDNSGGKVNILGGNSIGRCEKKEYVSNSELFPKGSCLKPR